MSKQIQVSDELYVRLKDRADLNYRSISGEIKYLLNNVETKVTLADIASPNPSPKAQRAIEQAMESANKSQKKTAFAASREMTPEYAEETARKMHEAGVVEKDCCQSESKLCSHWIWNDVQQVWVNGLSGRTKEVE